MNLQFEVAHRGKPADVFVETQAKPAIGLIGSLPMQTSMIGLAAENLGQHEAVFGLNEIRDGGLV
ncbi:hypothetical protein [Bradyrhizobium sp. USDA 4522]